MRTLSLDPGVKKVGVALWEDTTLLQSSTIKAPEHRTAIRVKQWAGPIERIIVEKMMKYRLKKVPHADLDRINKVIDTLVGLYQGVKVKRISPTSWKGGAPKPIIRARLISAGYPITTTMGHDEVDAIGIGAVGLGILRRGGIMATKRKDKNAYLKDALLLDQKEQDNEIDIAWEIPKEVRTKVVDDLITSLSFVLEERNEIPSWHKDGVPIPTLIRTEYSVYDGSNWAKIQEIEDILAAIPQHLIEAAGWMKMRD